MNAANAVNAVSALSWHRRKSAPAVAWRHSMRTPRNHHQWWLNDCQLNPLRQQRCRAHRHSVQIDHPCPLAAATVAAVDAAVAAVDVAAAAAVDVVAAAVAVADLCQDVPVQFSA